MPATPCVQGGFLCFFVARAERGLFLFSFYMAGAQKRVFKYILFTHQMFLELLLHVRH